MSKLYTLKSNILIYGLAFPLQYIYVTKGDIMNILTQNAKMKKSSQNGIDVYNFGIPAFLSQNGMKTCPQASHCATGCYARSGTYRFGNVVSAYEARLTLTQNESFVDLLIAEITSKLVRSKMKHNKCVIRIHDAGDFYNETYFEKWLKIVRAFQNEPLAYFYAYTKMVSQSEAYRNEIPDRLRMIYSFGGKQDSQIDTVNHWHSKVFQSETDLIAASYSDATQDDMVAALGVSKRIGLIYHGSKNYANTKWGSVSK